MWNLVILDDSKILRERLKSIIRTVDKINIVGETSFTDKAIEIIETFDTDILFLDIHTPGAKGLRTLSKIRKTNNNMKIIVLTSTLLAQYRTAARHMGADFFIDKSTGFEKIPQILNTIKNINTKVA